MPKKNTPVGFEGRGLSYAFRSLKAAAMKAQEIMESFIEPVFIDKLLHTTMEMVFLLVTSVGVKPNTAAANAITYLKNNKKFSPKSLL